MNKSPTKFLGLVGDLFLLSKTNKKSEPFSYWKNLVRIFLVWCERRDLNPYELPHTPLKRARLPIPPLSHIRLLKPLRLRARDSCGTQNSFLNFDRCAISLSLNHPPDAVKLNAADSATDAYSVSTLPSARIL